MRTSNKILLGTFLAILFIITAIHAALYAKYKSNDFITMKFLHNERYITYDFRDVQSVSLIGLQNVTIVPSDTARLEIEKNGFSQVRYEFSNGVLTIHGDTTIRRNNSETERVKSSKDVIVYLPPVRTLKADFCEMVINGEKDSAQAGSFDIELNETSLRFGGSNHNNIEEPSSFNKVNIAKSTGSTIEMSGDLRIKELSLNLATSSFEEGRLRCDSLFINIDNASSVKLTGKNIARTKFALKP